jgi:hypothetical protein
VVAIKQCALHVSYDGLVEFKREASLMLYASFNILFHLRESLKDPDPEIRLQGLEEASVRCVSAWNMPVRWKSLHGP